MEKLLVMAKQFVKFGIVGLLNTLISFSIYCIFIFISVDLYLVGNIVGFVVSVLNSYYWNNKYVFYEENRNHIKALSKTFMAYSVSFVFGTVLLIVMVEIIKISVIIVPLINLVVTVPLNFMLNKFWAFKEDRDIKI
jgi:putative flippase GtrA